MIFIETALPGVFIIDLECRSDERGFFARSFCQREFAAYGLTLGVVQTNLSCSYFKGTVRGLHFQYPPAAEAKIVTCTRGAILDVIVDLRPESPTYLQHLAVELSAENHRRLYVPERFAHGFQVLEDNVETAYLMSEFYTPEVESGVRHDDPRLAIRWPLPVSSISGKDRAWPLLDAEEPGLRARMTVPVPATA